MKHLGIQMIAAYSPKVRGRSERAFLTHQDRLPKELALHGITDMDAADRYLEKEYKPDFNSEFMQPPAEERSAFVPYAGGEHLDDILCIQEERVVSADNCVSFEGMKLQIPPDKYRCHYVRVRIMLHCYRDGSLAIFHGPRKLANYDKDGKLLVERAQKAA